MCKFVSTTKLINWIELTCILIVMQGEGWCDKVTGRFLISTCSFYLQVSSINLFKMMKFV